MDEEELEQPRKKITISNFFESIQSIDKVANRALKKTESNLGIISENKSLIEALSKSFDNIITEVREIKEYVMIKDEDKDKLFSQEDQEQKIKRLERLQGLGDKSSKDDRDFKKQASETVKKALQDPNIMQMFTGLIGLSVSGLLGLGASALGMTNSKNTVTQDRGFLGMKSLADILTLGLSDFDQMGRGIIPISKEQKEKLTEKPRGLSRIFSGVADLVMRDTTDFDKRGGDLPPKEVKKKDNRTFEEKFLTDGINDEGIFKDDNLVEKSKSTYKFEGTTNTAEGKDKLIIMLGKEINRLDDAEDIPGADLKSILAEKDTLEEAIENLRFNEKDNQFGGYDYLQKFLKEQNQEDKAKGLKFGTEIGGVDGPDGIDRIPAMLTKGETVLSKDESENLKEMGVFNVDKLVSGVKKMYSSSEDEVIKNPYEVDDTNTPDFALLTAISALEGGDPQARVDVAQSIYNRVNEVKKDIADGRATDAVYDYTRKSFETDKSGVFPEPTISDIILKNAQYQPAFIDPNISDTKDPRTNVSPEFLNVSNRETAIKAMKSYYDKRGDKRSMKDIEALYDQTALDLQDQKLNKSAAAFVGGRTEFESGDSFKIGDQYRGERGVDNTFFMGYSKDEDGNKIRDYGTGTQLETGAAVSPLLKSPLETGADMSPLLKSPLESNLLSSIIESKSNQLAENIFTPPSTENNKINLLPIPINQQQSQPTDGNVPVAAPKNTPQVTTTPVASTISSVSFVNMISNKELSIG